MGVRGRRLLQSLRTEQRSFSARMITARGSASRLQRSGTRPPMVVSACQPGPIPQLLRSDVWAIVPLVRETRQPCSYIGDFHPISSRPCQAHHYRAALDAAVATSLQSRRHRRGACERRCWARVRLVAFMLRLIRIHKTFYTVWFCSAWQPTLATAFSPAGQGSSTSLAPDLCSGSLRPGASWSPLSRSFASSVPFPGYAFSLLEPLT